MPTDDAFTASLLSFFYGASSCFSSAARPHAKAKRPSCGVCVCVACPHFQWVPISAVHTEMAFAFSPSRFRRVASSSAAVPIHLVYFLFYFFFLSLWAPILNLFFGQLTHHVPGLNGPMCSTLTSSIVRLVCLLVGAFDLQPFGFDILLKKKKCRKK